MKNFCLIINVLASFYLMGDIVRQNKSFDNILINLENRTKGIIDFFKFLLVLESLLFLKKLFGWIGILLCVIYTILSLFNLINEIIIFYIGIPFIISFYIWFSVSWVLNHKETIRQYIPKEMLFVFVSPLMILIFDFISDTNYFYLIDSFIKREFYLLEHIKLPYNDYRISWAIFYTAISFLFVFIWYLLTWVIIAPLFIIILLCVISPVFFARFLNKMFPRKPLVGIAVFLWAVSLLYISY